MNLKKSSEGELIISRLNESLLRDIAKETGGIYVHAGSNRQAMATIYNRGIKNQRHGNGLERGKKKSLKTAFSGFWFWGLSFLDG